MKLKLNLMSATLIAVFASSGCTLTHSLQKENEANYESNKVGIAKELKNVDKNEKSLALVTKVKGSWLGAKSVPLAQTSKLPESFYSQWSFTFPGRANIATVAERVTLVTGITVKVRPDAYMPLSLLVPGGQQTAAPTGAADPSGAMTTASAAAATGGYGSIATANAKDYSTDVAMDFHGNLIEFLDRVCSRASVNWEYKEGRIELFRLETRNFTLKTSPGDSSFTSSVGKTGSTQGGTSSSGGAGAIQNATQSNFNSDSNIKMNSSFSVWTSVEAAIKAILSPVGKVSINQATGTITVTDSKENVDLVANLINRENSMLTRQVRIKVETINVSLNRGYEKGVDWNLVYSKLDSLLSPEYTLNFGTPTSLTTAQSGSLGFTISGGGGNRFDGTSAMIKALSEIGHVVSTNSSTALTTNRQPVPIALTDQVGYVASTTPVAAVAGGTGGAPGLTPGTVTTGYILNMLPTVRDDGKVLLQFAVDMSQLNRLDTVTSGVGANQQSIQTPQISSMQFVQRTALRPGETLVLSGFERESNSTDRRNLSEHNSNTVLDGSSSGKGKRDALVIMITPIIEGGSE